MGKLIVIIILGVCIYLGVTSFGVSNDAQTGSVTVAVDKVKASEAIANTKSTTIKTYKTGKKIATAVYSAVKE